VVEAGPELSTLSDGRVIGPSKMPSTPAKSVPAESSSIVVVSASEKVHTASGPAGAAPHEAAAPSVKSAPSTSFVIPAVLPV
jgi:hypothetical protein